MDDITEKIRIVDFEIKSIEAKIDELNKRKRQLLGKKMKLRQEFKISALLEEKMGITDSDDISEILELIRSKGYISGEKC